MVLEITAWTFRIYTITTVITGFISFLAGYMFISRDFDGITWGYLITMTAYSLFSPVIFGLVKKLVEAIGL